MTSPLTLSARLIECAKNAGYTVRQGTDGRTELSFNHGELRYIVERATDGWIDVLTSERLSSEVFIFAAQLPDVTERYLLTKLGAGLREQLGLPEITFPITRNDVADGYAVESRNFRDAERQALIDPSGAEVAVSGYGAMIGTLEMVWLSYHMTHTPEAIIEAYSHPDAAPLFEAFLSKPS
ncbi:Imm61 family immunity protein [Mycolicibacterium smegmatis]|uniref:Imm61 family immunity protein n=1 Tax=Mycolicibacterium smegmatis TaxID=1772 RepID=UPI001E56EBDB|nr:Imm61 family immunity protein [Mycolicibacterium smegmatis]MCP2623286.1 TNT antitoxin family protein [Mycolicibacterium smegmatis]UGU31126.1 TNT antitoxin family protein [Mycolicibacterium smegmatis]ULN36935.1 TNT antitoxin family protein [Mycolicibacterium smegmatis]ULN72028.1 TNT antitoxin family protein [Mycolicibacterium smegmatis]